MKTFPITTSNHLSSDIVVNSRHLNTLDQILDAYITLNAAHYIEFMD
jgi:hypothetical protein